MPRRVFNLERDIKISDSIVDRVRRDVIYAQNLYAALCNNTYQPEDAWGILSNIKWECTWLASANIIAEIRQKEEYTTWFCSGSGIMIEDIAGFVEESYVTEEIEHDINSIGWLLLSRKFLDI